MYDELVRELREEAEWAENTEDFAIPTLLVSEMRKAADAIEELQRQIDAWVEPERKALIKSLPKWIPVTERLPEEPYGCLLVVWDSPYGGGDDFLNYLPYFAGYDGEQWNDGDGMQVPFEVEYWMPLPSLPEPPKEEA